MLTKDHTLCANFDCWLNSNCDRYQTFLHLRDDSNLWMQEFKPDKNGECEHQIKLISAED
jgi:hypothetical protein